MPNWTENTLVVQATTKKEIDDFLDEVIVDEEFDFNTIIRMPHELSEGLGLAGSCLQGEDLLKSTMILKDGVYVPKDIKTRKAWIEGLVQIIGIVGVVTIGELNGMLVVPK